MPAEMPGSTGPGPGPVSGITQNWLNTSATATDAQNARRSLAASAPRPNVACGSVAEMGGRAISPSGSVDVSLEDESLSPVCVRPFRKSISAAEHTLCGRLDGEHLDVGGGERFDDRVQLLSPAPVAGGRRRDVVREEHEPTSAIARLANQIGDMRSVETLRL